MSLTPSTMLPLGTKAPKFDLPTTTGENITLNDFQAKKALVVMFICNHCPYVIHIKNQLIKIGNDYQNKSVGIVAINSNDPDYDSSDSFENMKNEGYPFPYAFDKTQEVAKAYSAACTPDIYVFNQNRELVYRGQSDDSRPGNGLPTTGKDLRNAIDAVLNETEVDANQKPSTGCNIKWRTK
ncbi:thioredoxin family protein [bacterium]|nr:thioredoxin family protein [bacterium]